MQCDISEDLNLKRCGSLEHSALYWMLMFGKRKGQVLIGSIWKRLKLCRNYGKRKKKLREMLVDLKRNKLISWSLKIMFTMLVHIFV
jgi:hypothetical protein